MNLHGVVSGVIAAVNPTVQVSVQISSGYATGADAKRTPTYRPIVVVPAQIQSLTAGDLRQIEALNLGGIKRAIYLFGRLDGIDRPDKKGGDLITVPAGALNPNSPQYIYLVAQVLEYWPDWVKVAATMQNGS